MGKSLIENANNFYEILATYIGNYYVVDGARTRYRKLDIKDREGYVCLFEEFQPEVVIHTAGVGSPDFADKNKIETWEINVVGTQNIVDCCERFNSKFIYISSNGIYDGENAPYTEEDNPLPINYYGQIKLEGEKVAKKAKITCAIVRPILMYGWNNAFERMNIITLALQKLEKNEVFYVYEDVFCNPLFTEQCAEAIWRIIQKEIYGIYNIAGNDILSTYQFVKIAAGIFGLDTTLVKPVQQGFFKDLVKRPRDTSYNIAKMKNILGLEPLSVETGLKIMKSKTKRKEDA